MPEEVSNSIWGPILDKYNNGEEISFEEESVLFFVLILNNYDNGKKLSFEERCTVFWSVLDYYNKGKIHPKEIRYMKNCRKIIKDHHDEMSEDPERLTSEFLIKLTGCKCNKLQH